MFGFNDRKKKEFDLDDHNFNNFCWNKYLKHTKESYEVLFDYKI